MKKIFYLITLTLYLSSCSVAVVDVSEVGLKFNKFTLTEQGKLDAVPVSGWIFYNPVTTDVFTYPVYIQRVNYKPFKVNTKDAAEFSMDPILAYQIDRTRVVDIFTKYRKPLKEIEIGFFKTCVYDAYRITANEYTANELMANRAEFEAKVRTMLDKSLGAEGFIVQEFTSQITPPASLKDAIDQKNRAIEESLKAENLVKQAEANAKIAVAEAEGAAKAMKIKADAEAYYNRTISASLSTLIVQEDWIEKWDGKCPQYLTGSGSSLMKIMP